LWDKLVALPDNAMVQVGISETTNGGNGLIGDHVYTVLRRMQVNGGPKLIELRNPYGRGEWTGDWSDDSDLWTDALREAYGIRPSDAKDDGVFFISYEDYFTNFEATFINHDTSDLFRADWLILDDKTDSPGSFTDYCGDTCTRHEFTLTSTVAQKVIVSGNTW